jgi:hypothetical protein
VIPRCANAVVYTARWAVMPGEMPFQFDTGSEWIAASDTLSAAAVAIALPVCSADRCSSSAAPAATEIASCSA